MNLKNTQATLAAQFQKNKVSHCFHRFPIYFPWSDGPDSMIFIFWMLSFKPTFSLSSFTFIKRLFSSSSLSAIRLVSYAYLRLLIFPLTILIPSCDSSSPVFHSRYTAYKLNKKGEIYIYISYIYIYIYIYIKLYIYSFVFLFPPVLNQSIFASWLHVDFSGDR